MNPLYRDHLEAAVQEAVEALQEIWLAVNGELGDEPLTTVADLRRAILAGVEDLWDNVDGG